jgi:hypothetical protein
VVWVYSQLGIDYFRTVGAAKVAQATSRAADLDELQLRYSILVSRINLLKDYRYASLFPTAAWYQQQIGALVRLMRQTDQRLSAHDDYFDRHRPPPCSAAGQCGREHPRTDHRCQQPADRCRQRQQPEPAGTSTPRWPSPQPC